MPEIQLNGKTIATQTGTNEPVLKNNVVMESGFSIPSGVTFPAGHVIQAKMAGLNSIPGTTSTSDYSFNYTDNSGPFITPLYNTSEIYFMFFTGIMTDVDNDSQGGNNGRATFEYKIGTDSWPTVNPNTFANIYVPGRGGNANMLTYTTSLTPNTLQSIYVRVGIKKEEGGRVIQMSADWGPNRVIMFEIAA